MLKGRSGSGESVAGGGGGDMAAGAVVAERPRKKLSFREPEIMGYYMQMKQDISKVGRKNKRQNKSPPEEELQRLEDGDLEVFVTNIYNIQLKC